MTGGNVRILYASNAFWAKSGYGVQGASLLPRLKELDCVDDVAMFAWYGLMGGMAEINGIKCYPQGRDAYGNDVIGTWTHDFNANVTISLIDVWVCHEFARKVAPAKWLPWFPVDHDPVPQAVLNSLQGAWRPLVYSKWALKMMRNHGYDCTYIPHGVETNVMKILPNEQRLKARKDAGIGANDFLAVIVAANKGWIDRKAFQVQMRSFAEFLKHHPDSWLYIHAEPSRAYDGLDLVALAQSLGIANRVKFPIPNNLIKGLPAEHVAAMLNAGDVLMAASMSEGFGIPIIEAQACGIPVVTTDFSAMPELVRWGQAIEPVDYIWTQMNSWQAWPDVVGVYQGLEWAYQEKQASDWWDRRAWASKQIHDEFGWDYLVDSGWRPFLEWVSEVIARQPIAMRPFTDGYRTAAEMQTTPVVEQVPDPEFVGDEQVERSREPKFGEFAGDTGGE